MRLDYETATDAVALDLSDDGQPNKSQSVPPVPVNDDATDSLAAAERNDVLAAPERNDVLARQRYIARQHAFLDTVVRGLPDCSSGGSDNRLSADDVAALTRNMPFLDADVLSLVTGDEFRTVVSRTGHNSTISSLAGILKEDVDLLQKRIFSKKQMYDKYNGSNPVFLLNKCKKSGLIDYSASRAFNTIKDVELYLKTNAKQFEQKSLLLSQYKVLLKNGHSVVLKYKIIDDQPVKLLVDYEKPGLLMESVPNPYRFDVHLNFEDFKFFVIYDIQKKYANINDVRCSCKRL